jgi:hypothetical protein
MLFCVREIQSDLRAPYLNGAHNSVNESTIRTIKVKGSVLEL